MLFTFFKIAFVLLSFLYFLSLPNYFSSPTFHLIFISGRNVHLVGTANSGQKQSFTKMEAGPNSEMYPPFFIGYYQDKHFQSLEIDRVKEEMKRKEEQEEVMCKEVLLDDDEAKSLVPTDAEPASSVSPQKRSAMSETLVMSIEHSGMSPNNSMSPGPVSGGHDGLISPPLVNDFTMAAGEEVEMTLLKKSKKLGLVVNVDESNGLEVSEFNKEECILLSGDLNPGDKIIKFNNLDVRQTSASTILDVLRQSSALPAGTSIPMTVIKRQV